MCGGGGGSGGCVLSREETPDGVNGCKKTPAANICRATFPSLSTELSLC